MVDVGVALDRVVVIGLGMVGELLARLLHRAGHGVTGADQSPRLGMPFPVMALDVDDPVAVRTALAGADAVVAALPYRLNLPVAQVAAEVGVHYFDLSEDTTSASRVAELADGAGTAFAPSCGLAPGLIAIVGASLARGLDRALSLEMKVGALPRHPSGLLGYAFNWSPEGVVNEYLNDCEVIRDGAVRLVPAMSDLETVWIGGTQLEAFATSGGLGTMCRTFEGRVDHMDYKTLRYPGHCQLMRFFFDELHLRKDRALAGRILVDAKPPVDDDVVYLYAAAEGIRDGRFVREQFVRSFEPLTIEGRRWRAISWTTAAAACAVLELVAAGKLPPAGLIRQEDVDYDDFLATATGRLFDAPAIAA